jgi:hypothetical protein
LQLTVDDDEVNDLALRLFIAIKKSDFKNIEELVERGRDKGLLKVRDNEGNTFIYLVALILCYLRSKDNILDTSAPLMQRVLDLSRRTTNKNNQMFYLFLCRFTMI